MASLLYRLGKASFRHWGRVMLTWLVVLVAVGGFAAAFSKPMVDSFTIPGIPSEEAADLQSELFPDTQDAFDAATVNVVVAAPEGESLLDEPYATATTDLVAALGEGPQAPEALSTEEGRAAVNPVVTLEQQQATGQGGGQGGGGPGQQSQDDPTNAMAAAAAFSPVSADGRIGVITYEFDVDAVTDVDAESQEYVLEAMDTARDSGLTVEANGQGMQEFAPPGGAAELIGVAIAVLVLLITFGSAIAAGLPILGAGVGVGLALTGITAATAFFDLGSTTPTLALMIGLAVAIDYSLFILARYRTELEHYGEENREEALGIAVGTAGSAVVFAGLTVLIALSALAVVRIPFLTSMGLAAAAAVLIAVLVALTLLPALLGMIKSWTFRGQVRRYEPTRDERGRVLNNGVRWARVVGRRPLLAVAVVVIGLGAIAVPLKDLYLAFPTDSTAAPDTTQRQASDLITEGFGPGREAPFSIVVDARDLSADERRQAYTDVATWAAGQDGVVGVFDPAALAAQQAEAQQGQDGAGTDGGAAGQDVGGTSLVLIPSFGPDDERTKDLLDALRDGESDIEQATGTDIGITGLTAITTDVSDRLTGALAPYLAIVVGLAFILLMIVFRSLLVPLTATVGFLLSVLATLGATVLFFQEGALGLFDGQPIVSFMPIFLIGVVFGLAMDYQVFLVTRMREAHAHGASPAAAVVDGFRNSARVVAAAAVIMTAVFAAFMLEDTAIIKMMGFGLASAVVFDAFVVRMVLIPGLMYLLGEKAWYLPRWLDRILPDVDVEGEKLDRPHLAGHYAEDDAAGADSKEPAPTA
ncbi:MAG: hypothetical protein CMH83_01450 [Nocardioides sp.]|nr:hypothetical protein [Nocardioides sp.]